MVEDLGDQGYDALGKQAFGVIAKANQTAGLQQIYTFFNTATPRIFADIDRRKAAILGVPTIQARQGSLGPASVNAYNLLRLHYPVTSQTDTTPRTTEDHTQLPTPHQPTGEQ